MNKLDTSWIGNWQDTTSYMNGCHPDSTSRVACRYHQNAYLYHQNLGDRHLGMKNHYDRFHHKRLLLQLAFPEPVLTTSI
jgi:hypothetical protein